MTEIVPAILTNDVSDFRKKYAELFALSHYFTRIHVDFIDNEFLPRKTVAPQDLGFLAGCPFHLAAHFMTFEPQRFFGEAKKSGFKTVIIQLEAFRSEAGAIEAVIEAEKIGLKPGISINPETPLFSAAKFIDRVNLIQLMGVRPGYQGHPFMLNTIAKIRELRSLSKKATIIVDGGIKVGIARQCAKAGADILIAGSAILRSEDEGMAIEALKADIEE